jgi:hypothetical protein
VVRVLGARCGVWAGRSLPAVPEGAALGILAAELKAALEAVQPGAQWGLPVFQACQICMQMPANCTGALKSWMWQNLPVVAIQAYQLVTHAQSSSPQLHPPTHPSCGAGLGFAYTHSASCRTAQLHLRTEETWPLCSKRGHSRRPLVLKAERVVRESVGFSKRSSWLALGDCSSAARSSTASLQPPPRMPLLPGDPSGSHRGG